MTDKNYTDVTLILDKSSSMASLADVTIESVNEFLDQQRVVDGKCLFSMVQFGTFIESKIEPTDVVDVPNLNSESYKPFGMTALLDAIGFTVNRIGTRLSSLDEEDRPGKVLVVIVTDGHENNSKIFTWEAVHKMISHQQNEYSWEFVFLGANIDVDYFQNKLNVHNAYTFTADAAGTKGVMNHLGVSIANYRTSDRGYAVSAAVAGASLSANPQFLESLPVPTKRTQDISSDKSDISN